MFLTLACLAVGPTVAVVASFGLADGSDIPHLGLITSGAGSAIKRPSDLP